MDAIYAITKQRLVLLFLVITFLAQAASGQEPCVSAERIQTLKSIIEAKKPLEPNADLNSRIQAMKADVVKQTAASSSEPGQPAKPDPQTEEIKKTNIQQMCKILNTEPWPGKSTVGLVGSSAWIFLVRNYLNTQLQQQLMQVIAAGAETGEIDHDAELAGLIDHIRFRLGRAQLFGTIATAQNGFLVLWPLLSDEKVNEWRKAYGLISLKAYLRALQFAYKMVVIRSTARPVQVPVSATSSAQNARPNANMTPLGSVDDQIVRIDTSLVTIDATIYGTELPKLEKDDFKIFEDDQEQQISAFNEPESPFDIVLLLDLSGSTMSQTDLIKKTTKRFVELKRDVDRAAVVTFATTQTVVSPLDSDRAKLLKSLSKIKDFGGTNLWDAEEFAMDLLKRNSSPERRKAIVVMTDGVDNALAFSRRGIGSTTLYADLLEDVRLSSIAIVPIYLDTEPAKNEPANPEFRRVYADARRTLQRLADESGGTYYTTKDIGDLRRVYERVMNDMGKVYSLGYEPKNSVRDGRWKNIRVEIPSHPEIKVRARSGYYSK